MNMTQLSCRQHHEPAHETLVDRHRPRSIAPIYSVSDPSLLEILVVLNRLNWPKEK